MRVPWAGKGLLRQCHPGISGRGQLRGLFLHQPPPHVGQGWGVAGGTFITLAAPSLPPFLVAFKRAGDRPGLLCLSESPSHGATALPVSFHLFV